MQPDEIRKANIKGLGTNRDPIPAFWRSKPHDKFARERERERDTKWYKINEELQRKSGLAVDRLHFEATSSDLIISSEAVVNNIDEKMQLGTVRMVEKPLFFRTILAGRLSELISVVCIDDKDSRLVWKATAGILTNKLAFENVDGMWKYNCYFTNEFILYIVMSIKPESSVKYFLTKQLELLSYMTAPRDQ